MIKIQNYINGEWSDPAGNAYLEDHEPATGEVYAQIPRSEEEDIAKAVEAAADAYEEWANASIEYRSNVLLKVAQLIEDRLEEFAKAESRDNGKPIKLATSVDIPRAVSNFRFYATAIKHFASESHFMERTAINYTLRRPIGVVGCISPWNLPLYLFSWKIAPALAAGNTVVAKPSEVTPMTAYLLSKACMDAGMPKGVLNIVHGLGGEAGEAIVTHPEVKAISFTGGTRTGEAIAALAAPKFKKLSLELGGKNPNLIFDDCDFDQMMKTTMLSSFANQGQICLCGSRIMVQSGIYDRFKEEFVKRTKSLKVGDPNDPNTKIGAVVSKPHRDKILSYIELAQNEGGKILAGGRTFEPNGRCKDGYFIEPTIIEGLGNDCRTNQEEIFGPVVTIMPFETEAEGLALANGVRYGLASTVWTSDLNRAHRVAEQIETGIVWVNCWLLRDLRTPFGGVKDSGMGREGGWEALQFFTEPKNVCIKYY